MATSALIGALRVTLGLDSAAFEKGVDRSIKNMDAMGRAGFRTGRALRGLAGIAASVGVALAGVFSVQLVKSSLDYAASIGEVASALGVTQKELQVYRHAATQVNLTQEELEKGLAKLTLTIGKAGAGAKSEAQYFERLGISIKDTEGRIRPTGDVLLDLADRLAAIPDPANRAAAVFAIFGRQGQKLIPLLEGGSEGLKQFAKEAEDAGAVLSDGDIAKADETADKIEALTQQLKVDFSREVAKNADAIASLASTLASLISWLAKAAGAYTGFFRTVGQQTGSFLADQATRMNDPVAKGIIRLFGYDPDKKKPPSTNKPGGGPVIPVFNAETLDIFGTGGGGGRRGGSKKAFPISEELGKLKTEIEDAFDTRNLPESLETAEDLRQKLLELADEARKAGVPMSAFSDQIAVMRTRISELEIEGLAGEAASFSREVEDMTKTVKALDLGALSPLEQRLLDVDDRYESLRQSIQEQIDENAILAVANEDAAKAMADLVALLGRVDAAHRKAADAATAQYEAEQTLRNLSAAQAGQRIGDQINDIRQARGDNGLLTNNQREAQQIERDLQAERLDALIQLSEYEARADEARRAGDDQEASRLQGLINLQAEYYDIVSQTTAEQIVTSQRLQDAYADFTSGLSDALYDMVTRFDFSLRSIGDVFLKLINDIFLRPATDQLASSIGGFLKSAFAGGFATGGVIPRGQWGIVGERGPEPIFAADGPLRVMPNESLGGGGAVFNITVQGAMSDRDARRTGNQIGSAAIARMSASRKAGIAG